MRSSMAGAFQLPYRESREGFWGSQTSTLNWCEEDYSITEYCAELINTSTNLVFIWLGLKGIRNCLLYSHPPIFILAYLGYTVVGVGSMAFHSTLKYSMQLADELPMIYTACIMAYATLTYSKSPRFSLVAAAGTIAVAWSITAYYLHAKNPVFHQIAYGAMVLSTVIGGMLVMERELRPQLRARNPGEGDKILSQMWKMALTGIGSFTAGFFIWNMDNIFCHHLVTARNHILLPWSILLEGHGWWHILTGLAYYLIVWRLWLHRCLDGSEGEFMLKWSSSLTSIPQVVPRTKEHSIDNMANGGGGQSDKGKIQ